MDHHIIHVVSSWSTAAIRSHLSVVHPHRSTTWTTHSHGSIWSHRAAHHCTIWPHTIRTTHHSPRSHHSARSAHHSWATSWSHHRPSWTSHHHHSRSHARSTWS